MDTFELIQVSAERGDAMVIHKIHVELGLQLEIWIRPHLVDWPIDVLDGVPQGHGPRPEAM